jgi:hypothetical protein
MWFRVKQIAVLVMWAGLAGCSGSDSVPQTCTPGVGAGVTISGDVTFDRVHHNYNNSSLNYSNISQDPVREAVVEAVCNTVVATSSTDAAGHYSLIVPGGARNMLIRVKAQMLRTGTPSWNFRVIDNTANGALYALVSSPFNTDASNLILDLRADSGWDGNAYAAPRSAAPFAILDSVYVAFNKVLVENPATLFPALNINWSVNNVKTPGNISLGQITSSHFNGVDIYLLGKENSDTDEYDEHVIIHEWGHYFERHFSRVDSIGGEHAIGDVIDMRVAFSEGFGNAYSAIASNDPVYADAKGPFQSGGFTINMENNCTNISLAQRGWYSECSVQSVLYDIYDSMDDGADVLSLGFTPLYNVLINEQKNTHATTSIFSFVNAIKQMIFVNSLDIDALLADQAIDSVVDDYGSSQSTDNTGSVDALPLYNPVTITSGPDVVNLCSSSEFQFYNGYEVTRFIRFTLSSPRYLGISASHTSGPGHNPDLYLYRNGVLVKVSKSSAHDFEAMNVTQADAGDYLLAVVEAGNLTEPGVGSTCYKITL